MIRHSLGAAMVYVVLASVQAAEPLDAFPEVGEGEVRCVLRLPAQADEAAWRVELIVGKTVQTDAVNRHFEPPPEL